MFLQFGIWLATTPSPTPTPTIPNDDLVTPGVGGFITVFLIAAAVVLLVFDMLRRVRRTTYKAEIRERLEAEQEANRAVVATEADAQDVDAADSANETIAPDSAPGTPPRV